MSTSSNEGSAARGEGLSRRAFLRASGLAAGSLGILATLGACSPQQESAPAQAKAEEAEPAAAPEPAAPAFVEQRVTTELPVPAQSAPSKTSYDCDVLVIGGGFAGLNAAMAAKDAGASVVMVDKGQPGYSGLSPWPSSHRWFDPEMGDDADAFMTAITMGGEYLVNRDWYQMWIDHSKEAYERLADWGLMDRFDRCADTKYWDDLDIQGYYDENASVDRHARWMPLIEGAGIEVAPYTMVVDVARDGDAVCGAVGFHVPSGTVVTFNAKSVVMAMGGGCYKPTGYPVGGNTFDGEYIAYNLGLPIANKEFDDFHVTTSYASGNSFVNNQWDWLENIWLCGGDITADTAESYATGKEKAMVVARVSNTVNGLAVNDGSNIEDQAAADIGRRGGTLSGNPDDIRIGKMLSPKPKADCYGAAVGMQSHFSGGVFCGLDDLEGATGIPGLWVAGDGINGCAVTGSAYPVGVGFTSNFTSIQGDIAGKAAAAYAASASVSGKVPQDFVDAVTAEIEAPLNQEKGFSPDWARDELLGIMSPFWVLVDKSEPALNAALTQVLQMRDKVLPKLQATNSHQQRLCLEMKHKVLSAEMKLRASLERQESRGAHYRSDYPYRDDDNFLCYITVTKGDDGQMVIDRVPLAEEWKGDTSAEYIARYQVRFPGEAKALGLPEEQSTGGWGK